MAGLDSTWDQRDLFAWDRETSPREQDEDDRRPYDAMKVMSVEHYQLKVALEREDLGDQGTNQDTNVTKASDVKDNEVTSANTRPMTTFKNFNLNFVS